MHQQELQPSHDQNLSPTKPSTPSIRELVKLNAPEWPYAVLGSVGAVLAGMEAPLFAFGITHILTAFYSPDASQMEHEVQRVALVFVGAGVVTIPIYLLQHYFYTLMGERLTTRVRLLMFSGFSLFQTTTIITTNMLNTYIYNHSFYELYDLL